MRCGEWEWAGGLRHLLDQIIYGAPCEDDLDGDKRVVSLVGHELEIASDSAIGVSVLAGAEAPGDFLLDLAHALAALGQIIVLPILVHLSRVSTVGKMTTHSDSQ